MEIDAKDKSVRVEVDNFNSWVEVFFARAGDKEVDALAMQFEAQLRDKHKEWIGGVVERCVASVNGYDLGLVGFSMEEFKALFMKFGVGLLNNPGNYAMFLAYLKKKLKIAGLEIESFGIDEMQVSFLIEIKKLKVEEKKVECVQSKPDSVISDLLKKASAEFREFWGNGEAGECLIDRFDQVASQKGNVWDLKFEIEERSIEEMIRDLERIINDEGMKVGGLRSEKMEEGDANGSVYENGMGAYLRGEGGKPYLGRYDVKTDSSGEIAGGDGEVDKLVFVEGSEVVHKFTKKSRVFEEFLGRGFEWFGKLGVQSKVEEDDGQDEFIKSFQEVLSGQGIEPQDVVRTEQGVVGRDLAAADSVGAVTLDDGISGDDNRGGEGVENEKAREVVQDGYLVKGDVAEGVSVEKGIENVVEKKGLFGRVKDWFRFERKSEVDNLLKDGNSRSNEVEDNLKNSVNFKNEKEGERNVNVSKKNRVGLWGAVMGGVLGFVALVGGKELMSGKNSEVGGSGGVSAAVNSAVNSVGGGASFVGVSAVGSVAKVDGVKVVDKKVEGKVNGNIGVRLDLISFNQFLARELGKSGGVAKELSMVSGGYVEMGREFAGKVNTREIKLKTLKSFFTSALADDAMVVSKEFSRAMLSAIVDMENGKTGAYYENLVKRAIGSAEVVNEAVDLQSNVIGFRLLSQINEKGEIVGKDLKRLDAIFGEAKTAKGWYLNAYKKFINSDSNYFVKKDVRNVREVFVKFLVEEANGAFNNRLIAERYMNDMLKNVNLINPLRFSVGNYEEILSDKQNGETGFNDLEMDWFKSGEEIDKENMKGKLAFEGSEFSEVENKWFKDGDNLGKQSSWFGGIVERVKSWFS